MLYIRALRIMEDLTDKMSETLNKDFSVLSKENKEKVIEMIKLLIYTQNTVIPEKLYSENNPTEALN